MKKYEAVIVLNPNLSSKVDNFKKDFEKLLKDNSFNIGHYILFNLEGDPSKLLEIETKIKYNESIIRHLFLVVKEHNGEDSSLFVESKNKKPEPSEVEKDKEDVKKDPEPVKEDVEDKSEAKQEEGEDNE